MNLGHYEPNWVDLVGIQHEEMHTGVLEWLLRHGRPRELVESFGLGLLAEGLNVTREHLHANGGRSDLFAEYERSGHTADQLTVEVKVDSELREQQLARLVSAEPGSHHLLLAIGAEGVRLFGHARERLGLKDWKVVCLEEWVDVLQRLENPPCVIAAYLKRLEAEVIVHAEAREAALSGRRPSDLSPRHALVYAWAWLRAVSEEVRGDLERWWPKREVRTGPTAYDWAVWDRSRSNWNKDGNFGIWLQLETGPSATDRRASVKVGASSGALRTELRRAASRVVLPRLTEDGWEAASERARATLCTKSDLADLSVSQVADVCRYVRCVAKEASEHGNLRGLALSTTGTEACSPGDRK